MWGFGTYLPIKLPYKHVKNREKVMGVQPKKVACKHVNNMGHFMGSMKTTFKLRATKKNKNKNIGKIGIRTSTSCSSSNSYNKAIRSSGNTLLYWVYICACACTDRYH